MLRAQHTEAFKKQFSLWSGHELSLGRGGVITSWLRSVRHNHNLLGGGHALARLQRPAHLITFKLVIETQIEAAWFNSVWPQVPMEKPFLWVGTSIHTSLCMGMPTTKFTLLTVSQPLKATHTAKLHKL